MKRRLDMMTSARSEPPLVVLAGTEVVSVTDIGDGSAARRFVELLREAGARPTDPMRHPEVSLRIVVRAPLPSLEARAKAGVLEEGADVVLGSVRPAFAALLASGCAPWATS
ncbi:MAG: hypothetical protein PVI24_18805 [Myxococcales bacterium]